MKAALLAAALALASGCAKRDGEGERKGAAPAVSAREDLPAAPGGTNGARGARLVATVESVVVPEVDVLADKPTNVRVSWRIAKGTGVNEEAPFRVRWTTSEGLAEAPGDLRGTGGEVQRGFDVAVTPTKGVARAHLVGRVEIVVCDAETHKVCLPVRRNIDMSFRVGADAKPRVEVFVALPEAHAG